MIRKQQRWTNDQINSMVHQYLLEHGMPHTAFDFRNESSLDHRFPDNRNVPSNSLIQYIQKGIQLLEIQNKLNSGNFKLRFNTPFQLLQPEIFKKHQSSLRKQKSRRAGRKGLGGYGRRGGTTTRKTKRSRQAANSALEQQETARNRRRRNRSNRNTNPRLVRTLNDNIYNYPTREVTELRGHKKEVFTCCWNPVNPYCLASGSADKTARIWTLPVELKCGRSASKVASKQALLLHHGTGMPQQPPQQQQLPPTSTTDSNGGPQQQPHLPVTVNRDVTTLGWSVDGELLCAGSYDGTAKIWRRDGKLMHTLTGHTGPIFSLRWNKIHRDTILTGSVDKTAKVWDVATGRIKQTFETHTLPILDVDWKDSNTFATSSVDKTIHVHREGDPRPIRRFEGHANEVNEIKWSPDGSVLGSCSDDYTIKLWTLQRETFLRNFEEHGKEIYSIQWSKTGPHTQYPDRALYLASASFDSNIKIWDVTKYQSKHTLFGHTDPVYSVSFSPDGRFLASGSFDSKLNVWNIEDGKCVRCLKGQGSIFEVGWNCIGNKIACTFSNAVSEEFKCCVVDFVNVKGHRINQRGMPQNNQQQQQQENNNNNVMTDEV